jgi:hypothetical protein
LVTEAEGLAAAAEEAGPTASEAGMSPAAAVETVMLLEEAPGDPPDSTDLARAQVVAAAPQAWVHEEVVEEVSVAAAAAVGAGVVDVKQTVGDSTICNSDS